MPESGMWGGSYDIGDRRRVASPARPGRGARRGVTQAPMRKRRKRR